MKKSSIIGVLILCFAFWGKAQVRNEIRVPDPEGYRTLKCDFHIHTVFSDGLVWPTVRVDEAYREGLDAIALTEHLEYRPHRQDIIASHNRSYEIAEKTARNNQVILIRGSEITRPMAPGHFNAIFLSDCRRPGTAHDRHIGYPSTHPDRYRFCTGPTPYDDLRICPGTFG